MKKVLGILISLSLILTLCSTVIYGAITFSHIVDSVSSMVLTESSVTEFKNGNNVTIAEVEIQNNTRDGYKLLLTAANGELIPANSNNGETAIPYTISASSFGGSKPANDHPGFKQLTVPEKPDKGVATLIMGVEASELTTLLEDPTDGKFSLRIKLDDVSFIKMAGSYSDNITLTYQDL